jgi:hypothetical protein
MMPPSLELKSVASGIRKIDHETHGNWARTDQAEPMGKLGFKTVISRNQILFSRENMDL